MKPTLKCVFQLPSSIIFFYYTLLYYISLFFLYSILIDELQVQIPVSKNKCFGYKCIRIFDMFFKEHFLRRKKTKRFKAFHPRRRDK